VALVRRGAGAVASRRPGAPRNLTYRQRDALTGYLFVLPQVGGFSVFVLGPILAVFWFSLHDWNLVFGTFEFTGLGNYGKLARDPQIDAVARNTVLFTLAYVPLSVGLGLALALLTNRALRGMALFRTLYFMPVVVSLVAWVIVWRFLLQADGGLNAVLQAAAGIQGPNWLRDPEWALVVAVLVQIFKNAGLAMVLFLAALQGIPQTVQEAARVDGAGRIREFRHITLPLITPFIYLTSILAVIAALKSFSLIFLMTRGGPGNATTVLAYYIYKQAFEFSAMGYASALAAVLFALVLGLTVAQFVTRRKWVYSET
jgi:multiple sugar transport system permease protein